MVCKQGSAKQMQITTINNLARSWSLAMEEVEHQESGRKNLSQPLESLQGLLDGSSLQSHFSAPVDTRTGEGHLEGPARGTSHGCSGPR